MRLMKIIVAFIVSVAILSGCSSTEKKDKDLLTGSKNGTNSATTSGYTDGSSVSGEQVGTFGLGEQELIASGLGPEFTDPTNLLSKQTVYFMFDSSQVQRDFIPVVAAHAGYLINHPEQRVILGGHADERGSREYNIALAEQRAKSVYRMMKIQGVSDSQLEIVSYGEEKPAVDGMNEASWQLNRRVDISYQGQ